MSWEICPSVNGGGFELEIRSSAAKERNGHKGTEWGGLGQRPFLDPLFAHQKFGFALCHPFAATFTSQVSFAGFALAKANAVL